MNDFRAIGIAPGPALDNHLRGMFRPSGTKAAGTRTCGECGRQTIALINGRVCSDCHNRLPSPPSKPAQVPVAARDETAFLAAEMDAIAFGAELGARHGHEASALTRALGIDPQYVDAATLQDPSRPEMEIRGRCVAGTRFVQIADHLRGRDHDHTVVHESGHAMGLGESQGFERWQSERIVESFTAAFMKRPPSPAERHHQIVEDGLDRERAAARARSVARR